MISLPAPMPPQMSAALAYGLGAGLIVAGAAFLAWGRQIGRVLTMAGAAALGYLFAQTVHIDYVPPIAVQLVFVLVMLAFGYVFERLIWAGVAVALLAAVAAAVQLRPYIDPPDLGNPLGADQFARKLFDVLVTALPRDWATGNLTVLLACLGVVALVVTVALFRPKWIRIVMASLFGALCVTAGLMLIVCQIRQAWWVQMWTHLGVVLGVVALPAVLAMVVQFVGLARSGLPKGRKSGDKDKDKAPGPKPSAKPAAKAPQKQEAK